MVIHVVKSGDTLGRIAAEYGVDTVLMAKENGIALDAPLAVGQTIVVQFPAVVHAVKRGETLESIALRYGVSINRIRRNNRWLMGKSTIYPGEDLVIAYYSDPMGETESFGYAYPYIDSLLLNSVLPYLSYLTPFTYGISEQGHLVPLEDEWMLAAARNYSVGSTMHVSTLTENGTFSSAVAEIVLSGVQKQNTLIAEILQNMLQKGYSAVDVDFEYIDGAYAASYAEFIAALRGRLSPYGYRVIVALAPKTSNEQRGVLYEGHNYAALGAAADAVFLMTYEWGYTYGPPMAVAPIPNVREVLDYAVEEIPPDKIFLGVPLYGYDWRLPYVRDVTRATSISNVRATEIAVQYGAEIKYDATAKAPFFGYRDEDGGEHIVWFEDARSIREKLLLISEYGLRGVGYWNLDRPFPQNWLVLNDLYDIK